MNIELGLDVESGAFVEPWLSTHGLLIVRGVAVVVGNSVSRIRIFTARMVATEAGARQPVSSTDKRPIGPHEETVAAGRPVPDAYRARMKFLQDEAAHDGHVMNHASRIDFERFVRSALNIRRGDLILMDNGNLRAIWRDEREAHLGLQFLGGGMVQYVIFKRRENEQSISRVTGRDSLEGLERQFDAFELRSLLYE